MPRPSPLTRSSSFSGPTARGDGDLTPRTPHSRSGLAEEAYTDIELEELRDGDRQPLLEPEGYRSHGDDYDSHLAALAARKSGFTLATVGKRLPLVLGACVAAFLLFLSVLSYKAPNKLHEYLGATVTSTSTSSDANSDLDIDTSIPSSIPALVDDPLVLQYSKFNYTKFPLDSMDYDKMCNEIFHGIMNMPDYWTPPVMGIMDVVHHDKILDVTSVPVNERICSSTITYMLDHYIGLSADLALMAQAAALAREVRCFYSLQVTTLMVLF